MRCVRTALFPCQHNQNLDRQLGDRATVSWTSDLTNRSPSEFSYAVEPANVNPHFRRVVYRFSSSSPRGNTVVEVTGPVDQFICSLNPRPTPMGRRGGPENEGVLFPAPPGSLGQGSSAFGAIFGVVSTLFIPLIVLVHIIRDFRTSFSLCSSNSASLESRTGGHMFDLLPSGGMRSRISVRPPMSMTIDC